MKKAIIGILGGIALGTALVLLVFYIWSFQDVGSSGNHSESVTDSVQTETMVESEETESEKFSEKGTEETQESEWPTELPTEPESWFDTEVPTEDYSDSEDIQVEPSESQKPEEPKEIPYYIKVNRAANCVTIYTKDEEGNYTVPYKSMICSVGTYYWDTKTETIEGNTPLGTYEMPGTKYKWRMLFGPDGMDVYGYYTTRIVGHILFHSVPYTTTSNDKLWEGQYNKLGSPASKGCIRLSVADAKWIYDNCGKGTIVEIYDDADNPGPLGRPEAIVIGEGSPYAGWDPTDPDPKNPWNTGSVVISGVTNVADIERGTSIDWTKYFIEKLTADTGDDVVATDVDGLNLTVSINSSLDVYTAGKYALTYNAVGVTGKTDSKTIVVNVVDTISPILSWDKAIQTFVVDDSTVDLEARIKSCLVAMDVDADGKHTFLDDSSIVIEMKDLLAHMEAKEYGTYICKAYCVDASGNKSLASIAITVVYEQEEEPESTEEPSSTEETSESEETSEPEEPTVTEEPSETISTEG